MQGKYKKIIFERQGRIAVITINRPEVRNAIDSETVDELSRAFVEFRDDPELWVGIVTGTGDKAFSAGADLASASAMFSGGKRAAMPGHGRIYYGVTKGQSNLSEWPWSFGNP